MRVKKEINMQIGERIKAAREHAKMTQEQLAEYIDVSPQYISDLERGVVGISISTLKRLCIALGVSSDQILFDHHAEKYAVAIGEKCTDLTDEQFQLLLDIIDKFIEAIHTERK